jgi:hypothetical protein
LCISLKQFSRVKITKMKRYLIALPLALSLVFSPVRADEAKTPTEAPKIPDISGFPVRELTLQELMYVNHLNEVSKLIEKVTTPLSKGEKIEDNLKIPEVLQNSLVAASKAKYKTLSYQNVPESFRLVNDYACAGALSTYLGLIELRDSQMKGHDLESAKKTYIDGGVLFYKAAVKLRVATEKKPQD